MDLLNKEDTLNEIKKDLFTENSKLTENDPTAKIIINNDKETEASLNIRCMRKKYKCIMLWLLSIVVVTEFLMILMEKIDERYINSLIEKVLTLSNLPQNRTTQ